MQLKVSLSGERTFYIFLAKTYKMIYAAKVILFCTLTLQLSSCIAYRPTSLTGEKTDTHDFKPTETAYVTNRESLGREHKILRHSGLYELVSDRDLATVEIELQPLRPLPMMCLTSPVVVQAFTLGFYPVAYPANAIYSYTEIKNDQEVTYTLDCYVDAIVSWLHLFSPKKNKKKALGRALGHSYQVATAKAD